MKKDKFYNKEEFIMLKKKNGNAASEKELLAMRLGMSLEEFKKAMASEDETIPDRLGMSVEDFRKITMPD